jgi:2,3-dihydroxybenzoate-AMP ligase
VAAVTQNGCVPRHPRATAERYFASGAWTRATTAQRFSEIARAFPDREAIIADDATYTYAELDTRSDRVAVRMREDGLATGDAVLVQVGNSAEAVVGWYALLKAGAVPVATLAAHRAHEILAISRTVRAVGHVVDATVAGGELLPFAEEMAARRDTLRLRYRTGAAPSSGVPRIDDLGMGADAAQARREVEAVQSAIDPEDVAVYQLSGGTTGTPKVIPRLHAEYWNNALANSSGLRRDESSRIAHVMPFVHNAGMLNAVFGAHSVGGRAVLTSFGSAEVTLPRLVEAGVTDMMIAGPMVPWVEHPLWVDLSQTLKILIFSGSKVPPELFDRVTSLGTWMGQTWGMAEGPYATTPIGAPADVRANTVGVPVQADDSVRVVSLNGEGDVADGEVGVLRYRGPSTIPGYLDAAEHNAVAFDVDGYLDTGDLFKVVEHDGVRYLSMEGRVKDVISRGGEKFSTEEVEKLLVQHAAVREVAVVAMPDPLLGERSCAFVVLVDGVERLTLAEVQQHFASLGVAKFKWPERLESLTSLPRTNTMKVDKQRLRVEIADRVARGSGSDVVS